MIKNYFKTAWRNLLKNKTFSLINIIGLSVSMAVCLLIILIINDQDSYDDFNIKKDRIYRVHTASKSNSFNEMASTAWPLAQELRENYTGIEATAALVKKIGGDIFYTDKTASGGGYFADANLFRIMDFALEQGDPATALSAPFSMVITEELSKQLFYNENPVGKVVKFNDKGINPAGVETGNKETPYGQFTITGVLKPNPGKTSLPFKLLASLSTIPSLTKDSVIDYPANDWNNVWTNYTYVLLPKGKTKADLQAALDKVSATHYSDPNGNQFMFTAASLDEITPGKAMGNPTHTSMPEGALIFLSVLCVIIMLSACLNYTNLSVARLLSRAKEVGIRKVSGASRKQIFGQFIAEAMLTSFIALIISLLLLLILQPLFTGLWLNRFFNISFAYSIQLYLVFVGFSLLIGLIAGLLPAAYISVFNPVQVFKSMNSIKIFKGLTVRRVLLVVQFAVSLIFIISATLIYKQTTHVFNFDYGFNKDNVVNIKLYKNENYDRFVHAVSAGKNIVSVGACSYPPASGTQNKMLVFKSDNTKDSIQANFLDIDSRCMDVWGLKLAAGKNLPEIASANGEQYMLINEKMVSAFKYPSAAAAIGQRILIDGNNVEIVGVVKDFQFLEVNRGIEPLMLRNRPGTFGYITVRIAAQQAAETVAFLQAVWKKVNPDTKFEYEFFDSQVHMFHSMLSDAAAIIGFLAFLAVLVSCLGLLGMAVYTAETKRKEVGIRKVLGSGMLQIIFQLSKGFLLLLGIAVVAATPVAYILNNMWLQSFASRVSISPAVLLTGIAMLGLISLLIVCSQAWRAWRINPVKSLRTE